MKRERTDDDRRLRMEHLALDQATYTRRQVDAMVNWFRERKDALDFVTVEPHDHFGCPTNEPHSMEAA